MTIGPIVGADGYGYVAVRQRHESYTGPCNDPPAWVRVTDDVAWTLVRLSRTGEVTRVVIDECHMSCGSLISPQQLLPDGVGGIVVNGRRWISSLSNWEQRLIQLDPEFVRRDFVIPNFTRIDLVGQGGTVFLQTTNGPTQLETQAFNILTGATLWANSPGYTLVAAHPDNGAAGQGSSGEMFRITATGERAETMLTTQVIDPVQFKGGWVGNGAATVKGVAGDFPDATRANATRVSVSPGYYEPRAFGDPIGASAQFNPGIGLHMKAHSVASAFSHMSLRVVPTRQEYWKTRLGIEMRNADIFGNYFFTFGAGPGSSDAGACSGTLVSDLNRTNDVEAYAWRLEKLQYSPFLEDQLVDSLLLADLIYPDSLPYACFPENDPGYYNSNSYAIGLIDAVGIPHPSFPYTFSLLFPGARKPVPRNYFGQ